MERIELTKLQYDVAKKQIEGDFSTLTSTDEENKAMLEVIRMADSLMQELDAYDELDRYQDMSMIHWFIDKYEEQQKS